MADSLETPVKAPEVDTDALETSDGIDGEGKELQTAETFPASYVEKLRTEAAEARVKAGRVDDFAAELFRVVVEREASAYLRDGSDLELEPGDYLNDDGYPDVDRIRDAAKTLADTKPYLARVAGDVGQGARTEPDEPVSLGGMLRAAAQ